MKLVQWSPALSGWWWIDWVAIKCMLPNWLSMVMPCQSFCCMYLTQIQVQVGMTNSQLIDYTRRGVGAMRMLSRVQWDEYVQIGRYREDSKGAEIRREIRPISMVGCPKILREFVSHIFSCDQAALQMIFSVCLSVCPSVCLSVRPSHLFHHVPIIVSSWNFQELLPMTKVTSMQKVQVRGQRSRSQRSTPNLTVSGL